MDNEMEPETVESSASIETGAPVDTGSTDDRLQPHPLAAAARGRDIPVASLLLIAAVDLRRRRIQSSRKSRIDATRRATAAKHHHDLADRQRRSTASADLQDGRTTLPRRYDDVNAAFARCEPRTTTTSTC